MPMGRLPGFHVGAGVCKLGEPTHAFYLTNRHTLDMEAPKPVSAAQLLLKRRQLLDVRATGYSDVRVPELKAATGYIAMPWLFDIAAAERLPRRLRRRWGLRASCVDCEASRADCKAGLC